MRMIGRFVKHNTMCYISHLDILRTMARAMSRANISVRFSQGFHPHAQFAFAQAAQMGMTSDYEIIDIRLEREVDSQDFIKAMNAALPKHLHFVDAAGAPDSAPAPMGICGAGEYLITPEKRSILSVVPDFLSSQEIIVIKKTKSGTKPLNIRPLVYALDAVGGRLHANLCLKEGYAVRPDMLMGALSEISGKPGDIRSLKRIGLFAEEDGALLDMVGFYRGLC